MDHTDKIKFTFVVGRPMPEVLSQLPRLAGDKEWGIFDGAYAFEVVEDGTKVTVYGLSYLRRNQPDRATVIDAIDFVDRFRQRLEKTTVA